MRNGHPAPYRGRRAALATKHGKERAVALPMRAGLGLRVVVPGGVDTDLFGTFTGEIERVGHPKEVASRKARLGMERAGLPLGMASEGSFGPHPDVPFAAGNQEVLVFVDDGPGIEVCEQLLTFETNFAHEKASSLEELGNFLARSGFPSHGLVVRPDAPLEPDAIRKGIATEAELREAFGHSKALSENGLVHVETDMRAHLNPTRMRAIRRVTVKLARRLGERCPECSAPGWGVVDVAKGLPCSLCGFPTDFVREEVFGCSGCGHRRELPRRDGLARVGPEHCPLCNP